MVPKLSRFIRKAPRFLLHPIVIFIVLQVVSVTLTVLWVMWYVNQSSVRFVDTYDVAFLVTGCILTGIILLGTVVLFTFAIKQSRLNKQQRGFVSSVTHELRSPVASIQLSLETLAHQDLDEGTSAKLFEMMQADLDRLVNLVDQILVSARLDRGIKMFEQIERFNVKELIASVVDHLVHLDRRISNIGNQLAIDCPPTLSINSAKPAVYLIISNLLENALKYSPAGSPISIKVRELNKHLEIVVKDKGFGIERREQKKIFKIFRRGDVATKRAIPGTGLGLFIVQSVLQVLGGKIEVHSLGRNLGSTFTVLIPMDDTNQLKSKR